MLLCYTYLKCVLSMLSVLSVVSVSLCVREREEYIPGSTPIPIPILGIPGKPPVPIPNYSCMYMGKYLNLDG